MAKQGDSNSLSKIGYFCFYGPVTTVILVRHAEKMVLPPSDPRSDDPPLSADGTTRAQTLAHVVGNAGIEVIFATEFQRTQMTIAINSTWKLHKNSLNFLSNPFTNNDSGDEDEQ